MSPSVKTFDLQSWVRPNVWNMQGYIPGEQPQGGKYIKLNTNENPYPPCPAVGTTLAALSDQESGDKLRKYPEPSGLAFRQQAAQVYRVSPEQILCGNGSDEVLGLIIRLFLEPGQEARWPTPTYLLYKTLVQMQGGLAVEFPFQTNWMPPEDFYAASPQLVFLANPNSPSGTCYDLPTLRSMLQRFSCPVVVDEAYADYAQSSAISLLPEFPNLIVSRTLSKSYALAGLRFGFVIASSEIVQQLHKIRDSYNCDALSIAIATAAMSDQDWLKANVQQIITDRQTLETSLQKLGFMVQPSQANFLWCQHPTIDAELLYQKLKERHILVRYMNYGHPFIGLRITVGTAQQNTALLQQLTEITT